MRERAVNELDQIDAKDRHHEDTDSRHCGGKRQAGSGGRQ